MVPMVTVVVTTFNRANLVHRAIASVRDQTFQDFELILVDDCSTDRTEDVIRGIQDRRIRYIRHDRNRGLAASRNTGMRQSSRSEYIAFLDDDDEWNRDKLEKQIRLANVRSSEFGIIYCGVRSVTGEGRIIAKGRPILRGDIRSEVVKKGLHTLSSSHLFLREALESVGGYDEDLRSQTEHDIWMKMGQAGYKVDYVDEPLVTAYQHDKYRLTGDLEVRIQTTKEYLNKWQPVLDEWFGESASASYRQRYFARVVGGLAAVKLLSGDLSGLKRAIRELFGYSDDTLYNSLTVLRNVIVLTAHRFLPRVVVAFAVRIKNVDFLNLSRHPAPPNN